MTTEQEQKDFTKLKHLNSIEEKGLRGKYADDITKKPLDLFSITEKHVEIDQAKKKFFITFPYPYMNGKLHLGHLFSISKSDIFSYYKEMMGYNVLFPFSFHCTGMPISASAQKLKREIDGEKVDVSVIGILESLGFKKECNGTNCGSECSTECILKFTDPYHWCRTFPKYSINSLVKFDSNIDWRRSFITTEINPYYDSFIKWQFNKLKRNGFVKFGKRYSIFCPVDRQACLDHDRRRGEGIKPEPMLFVQIKVDSKSYDKEYVLVRVKESDVEYQIPEGVELITTKNIKWVKIIVGDCTYICEELVYQNLKEQVENVSEPVEVDITKNYCNVKMIEVDLRLSKINVKSTGKPLKPAGRPIDPINDEETRYSRFIATANDKLSLIKLDEFILIQLPEDEIISRSGGICTVALLDQWFLDYGKEEWKEKTRTLLKSLTAHEDTHTKLSLALEWIHSWGCSRSFGLGTKFPGDESVLIDSLSDSTIYMAFYTVKHLLFKDLEGKDEIVPSKFLCGDFWDYLFSPGEDNFLDFLHTREDTSADEIRNVTKNLKSARESFRYFYPVDLRVSGKDLINNHLLFFLMNHVAMFDQQFWPKRIFTNGHLLLNSSKMSKSEGNFLTVDDALSRFGTSATRMCLAACGDTNEDANFLESMANSFILKLYTLSQNIKAVNLCESDALGKFDLIDLYLIESILINEKKALDAYGSITYRDVLKYAFYENITAIDTFDNMGGKNTRVKKWAYSKMIRVLYPLIPSYSRYFQQNELKGVSDSGITDDVTGDKHVEGVEYVKSIIARINKIAKSDSMTITVAKNYPQWKEDCIKTIDNLKKENPTMAPGDLKKMVLKECGAQIKANKKRGTLFCMDYVMNPEKYTVEFDEKECLETFEWFIKKETGKSITVEVVEESEKAEPKNPGVYSS